MWPYFENCPYDGGRNEEGGEEEDYQEQAERKRERIDLKYIFVSANEDTREPTAGQQRYGNIPNESNLAGHIQLNSFSLGTWKWGFLSPSVLRKWYCLVPPWCRTCGLSNSTEMLYNCSSNCIQHQKNWEKQMWSVRLKSHAILSEEKKHHTL